MLEKLLELFNAGLESFNRYFIENTPFIGELSVYDILVMVALSYITILLTKLLLKGLKYMFIGAYKAPGAIGRGIGNGISRKPEICEGCGALLEDCNCPSNKGLSTKQRYKKFRKEQKRIRKAKRIKVKTMRKSRRK